MTHAPMKPFWVVVDNDTGSQWCAYQTEGEANNIWREEIAAGTHRIVGPFGGEAQIKRKVVQASPVRCQGGWDNLVLIHDDGGMILVDGSTIPFNPKVAELLVQVGEGQPSELALELRAPLKPFSDEANNWDCEINGNKVGDGRVLSGYGETNIKVGHLRAARAALGGGEG